MATQNEVSHSRGYLDHLTVTILSAFVINIRSHAELPTFSKPHE